MVKKSLALLLCAVMLLCAVPLSAAADTVTFKDVPSDHFAKDAIARWSGYGIISGYTDGRFKPNEPMTRAQFARVLTGVLGLTDGDIANTFTDLPANSWYTPYILRAVKAGILSGDGKGHALPNKAITREQAFSMLARAVHLTPVKTPDEILDRYGDGDVVGGWARTMVSAMVDAGYVSGTGKNLLTPKHNITRGAVIYLLDVLFPVLASENNELYSLTEHGYAAVCANHLTTLTGTGKRVVVVPGSAKAEVRLSAAAVTEELIIDAPGATVVLDASKVSGVVRILADGVNLQVDDGSTVQEIGVYADNVTVRGEGIVGQITPYTGSGLTVTANVAKINNAPFGVSPLRLVSADEDGTGDKELVKESWVEATSDMDREGVTVVTVQVHGEDLQYHDRLAGGKPVGGYWYGIALAAPRGADGCIAGAGTTKESALKSFKAKTAAESLTPGVDPAGAKAGREIALDLGNAAYKDAVTPGGTGIWASVQWYAGKIALGPAVQYHIYFDVSTLPRPASAEG